MIRIICWVLIIVIFFQAGRAMALQGEETAVVEGIGAFLLASALVQSLFVVFKAQFIKLLGIHRLIVLAALSVIATISVNVVSGKSVVVSVLSDSGTLLAYQVLIHQIKKQWDKHDTE